MTFLVFVVGCIMHFGNVASFHLDCLGDLCEPTFDGIMDVAVEDTG